MLFRKARTVLQYGFTLSVALTGLALTGCNGGASGAAAVNAAQADETSAAKSTPSTAAPSASCVTNDPDHLCIGVKVVSYTEGGNPVVSNERAAALMQEVNELLKPCNIAFQLEEYAAVDPASQKLESGSNAQNQTSEIRQAFADNKTFLLAATGAWGSQYIAWTAMPGSSPYGVVIDYKYTDAVTTAHEFGHYMGLDHDDNRGNLMYYIAYSDDTAITEAQCAAARETTLSDWQAMLRR